MENRLNKGTTNWADSLFKVISDCLMKCVVIFPKQRAFMVGRARAGLWDHRGLVIR